MKLIYYPDEHLKIKCVPVVEFDAQLHQELNEMKKIMTEHNGLGLAANQCGLDKRMFLVKLENDQIEEIINPEILFQDGYVGMREGCLSAPNIFLTVARAEVVILDYYDRDGNKKTVEASGLTARCMLHEFDHLLGITFFERVNREARRAALSQLKKQ